MAGTTFPGGVKPLFVYNFHRCVGNNHEIVQAFLGVCCGGGVGSCGGGLGEYEDATIKEGLGWFNKARNFKQI